MILADGGFIQSSTVPSVSLIQEIKETSQTKIATVSDERELHRYESGFPYFYIVAFFAVFLVALSIYRGLKNEK